MNGYSVELLDLIARWVHVIAGIMWIGNSLLFNWLDR
ncbi:MAG: urate hydroxylase PuuD, partial [Gemmatimonadaceae bacterium]